ncbi:MAG: class I SAM-dependent methyltransferase [Candidatus Thorarchaeota archaeon]
MNKSIDYDSVSAIYDEVRTGDPEMILHLLQGITSLEAPRVLDVGCGTANNTLLFAKTSGLVVTGLDLSFGMLCEACTKAPLLSFVQAPADSIPFLDASFDFIFMTEVVHHLPDIRSAFAEIYRVTAKGGRICIVTQSHKQIEGRMTSRFFPATIDIDQARYPSIPSLEASLLDIGFSQIDVQSFQFTPVRLGNEYLETVEKRGYSMLHKISDDAYQEGLSKLRDAMATGARLDYAAGYSFVWAER